MATSGERREPAAIAAHQRTIGGSTMCRRSAGYRHRARETGVRPGAGDARALRARARRLSRRRCGSLAVVCDAQQTRQGGRQPSAAGRLPPGALEPAERRHGTVGRHGCRQPSFKVESATRTSIDKVVGCERWTVSRSAADCTAECQRPVTAIARVRGKQAGFADLARQPSCKFCDPAVPKRCVPGHRLRLILGSGNPCGFAGSLAVAARSCSSPHRPAADIAFGREGQVEFGITVAQRGLWSEARCAGNRRSRSTRPTRPRGTTSASATSSSAGSPTPGRRTRRRSSSTGQHLHPE